MNHTCSDDRKNIDYYGVKNMAGDNNSNNKRKFTSEENEHRISSNKKSIEKHDDNGDKLLLDEWLRKIDKALIDAQNLIDLMDQFAPHYFLSLKDPQQQQL